MQAAILGQMDLELEMQCAQAAQAKQRMLAGYFFGGLCRQASLLLLALALLS